MVTTPAWRRWLLLSALVLLGIGYLFAYAFFLAHSENFIVAGRNAAAKSFSIAHPIRLPAKLEFGRGKPDTPRLGGGWNLPEDGIWSNERTAWMLLAVAPSAGDTSVRMNCSVFVSTSVAQNAVTITVNDEPVGAWSRDESSLATPLEFEVPARLTKSGMLAIAIHVEHVPSPFQLGIGQDRRRLGLLLGSVELKAANAAASASTTATASR